MKNLAKVIRSAIIEHKSWEEELIKFLRNYRETPHPTTGVAPASLILRNPNTSTLPKPNQFKPNQLDKAATERNNANKAKTKTYADSKLNTQTRELMVGDKVLYRWEKSGKTSSRFDPEPYVVKAIKGTMVSVERPGHATTRNISFFKMISKADEQPNKKNPTVSETRRRESSNDDDLLLTPTTNNNKERPNSEPEREPSTERAPSLENRQEDREPSPSSRRQSPQPSPPNPPPRRTTRAQNTSKIPVRKAVTPTRKSTRIRTRTTQFVAEPASIKRQSLTRRQPQQQTKPPANKPAARGRKPQR
jgi:hypothetical protein